MKIAVLSDIHSNVFALDAVIKDLKRHSVDLKANLGDILYGPVAPKSTFELLMEHDFITISGNQDRQIYESTDEEIASNPTMQFILDDLGSEPLAWMKSLPFDKHYYEVLVKAGYQYSSSYFPLKTYMYGNSIDKKQPFNIYTNSGKITEYPILKNYIPYSGGFYLRVLPMMIKNYLFKNSMKKNLKPIIYIHPYELLDTNLIKYFIKFASVNLDFLLAFYSTSKPINKIEGLIK